MGIRTFYVDPLPIQDRPRGFAPMLGEALRAGEPGSKAFAIGV
ncbi:hypothetical protein [Streptosporangium sp. 'caverna']|nr:hypothetical protein [Streptosporangium sp. 'caverna']